MGEVKWSGGYVSIDEGIRRALDRKRRLRWLYKWRHGLPHTAQPANRDRFKIETLEFFDCLNRDKSDAESRLSAAVRSRMEGELFGERGFMSVQSGGLSSLIGVADISNG